MSRYHATTPIKYRGKIRRPDGPSFEVVDEDVEKLGALVTPATSAKPDSKPKGSDKAKGESKPEAKASGGSKSDRVNINTASAEEIEKAAKYIGEKTAADIVAWRDEEDGRAFESLDDLRKVGGISDKAIESNRDTLTV